MASAALYTPELLALATSLAEYPLGADLVQRGEARSPTCGSTLTVGIEVDPQGRVLRLGLRAQACAVGQAAAAIFAAAAPGRDRAALAQALAAMEDWLQSGDDLPDWPGIAPLQPARAFPGRHGAILLPWKAALAALPTAAVPG